MTPEQREMMAEVRAMFAGEYEAECIVDHREAAAGKADLPCHRVTGPGGLVGIVWGRDLYSERSAIRKFLLGFGLGVMVAEKRTIFEVAP